MSIVQQRKGNRWIRVPFTDSRGRLRVFRTASAARDAIMDLVHEVAEEHAFNPNISTFEVGNFRIKKI